MPPLSTPPELVSAIEEELAATRGSAADDSRALERLFRIFTSERGRLRGRSYLDDPALRRAYLRYHLPLNAARAAFVLAEALRIEPSIALLEEVVDLGAGPGSASVAALLGLPAAPARGYTLVDRSRSALEIARRILERSASLGREDAAVGGLREVRTTAGSLIPLPAFPRRALVWLSFVLNEAGVGARRGPDAAGFLRAMAKRLDPGSAVLVLEPALREPARSLLSVHDAAAESGDWRVLAPCTHQRSCPLLRERDRSWCHFRLEWRAPDIALESARPLGLGRDPPALSYLVLLRGPPLAASSPGTARVIGDPMRVRGGKTAVYICRDGSRELLEDPAPGVERGAVIDVERPPAGPPIHRGRNRPRSRGSPG
jgi:ribosomal protein RSM22 (predicted rRNA methylase)